ncbi:MAG: signal recognition particle protein [Deltaproteobacteria bacterium]|jgi:signal recognition particle subunit SRP54|nr:signal recognition particle protein [Deltaproteobacteria bacterium]MCL5880491.1 signal recognition particle protein [Deltaproteobacteria bacterium]MDA8304672.1 signal recognition particle protein [Deltaproteobacteria bacterium]
MFDGLSTKLERVFKNLRGYGKLSEKNIEDSLKEVRLSLLEADVNYLIVKEFIETVKNKAIGEKVTDSLTPSQQMIKIIRDEIASLLGNHEPLNIKAKPPVIIMLTGLQGSGKTTTAGKLALYLHRMKRRVYLIPADVYRPAAILQLKKIGSSINIPVYETHEENGVITQTPENIVQNAIDIAEKQAYDTLIIDTAGRLEIDEPLMNELKLLKNKFNPNETIFVADSMLGQSAVTVAKTFNEALGITGVILTKVDGDSRGGAALSIKKTINKPIKFIGVGEKLSDFEVFYGDRIADRILGMGDVLSLIDKAQEAIDEKDAKSIEDSLAKGDFTVKDFAEQLKMMSKIGGIAQIAAMIPGFSKIKDKFNPESAEKEIAKIKAIINSMTEKERINPDILNGNRRKRIASGSGTTVNDVNIFINKFEEVKKMMKSFKKNKLGSLKNVNNIKNIFNKGDFKWR